MTWKLNLTDTIEMVNGIYAIQEWIDGNQDKNPRVFDLWANGIASEINQCANLEQDIALRGGFDMKPGDAMRAAI